MSHSEIDRLIFANAHGWRKTRARIAANTRHGHDDRAQEDREMLPYLRDFAVLCGIVHYAPGAFELGTLGTEETELFYKEVDRWGAIIAPHAFRQAAS